MFEFKQMSILQLQGEFYLIVVGSIMAILLLFSEFCLKDSPKFMPFSYDLDSLWTGEKRRRHFFLNNQIKIKRM